MDKISEHMYENKASQDSFAPTQKWSDPFAGGSIDAKNLYSGRKF